jgi:formate hydrogenlyase subunit 3/multisubunit Na+/H+ antiporter MnhD subunit
VVVLGVLLVVLVVIVVGLQWTGLGKAWPLIRQEAGRSKSEWSGLPIKARVFAATCLVVGLAAGVLLAAQSHG